MRHTKDDKWLEASDAERLDDVVKLLEAGRMQIRAGTIEESIAAGEPE
jgi:hypothetical protein